MDAATLLVIQNAYHWGTPEISVVNSGLINNTFKVNVEGSVYLLQAVNTQVFKHPELIDENLNRLAVYFKKEAPGYLFTAPVQTVSRSSLVEAGGKFYRAFEWVGGSHTIDVVANPGQAYEAANAFGSFTSLLGKFDADTLHITLPQFHDLSLRYYQFEQALQAGNAVRINECKDLIKYLRSQQPVVKRYETFIAHKDVKKRVSHHDTKISNVLFNDSDKSLCVIDLDTVMPGYFLSDVGDMMRTYVCPVSEEEKDLDKICIRKEYIDAIRDGYLNRMSSELSSFEEDHFYFAGEMLIYMQALRFLSDYLNNDSYYGSRYEGQNKVRAENQSRLLTHYQQAT